MKKKILSLLLALCLIVGLLPLAAMAAEATIPEKYIGLSINNGGNKFWYYDGVDATGANVRKYWVPGTAATYATTTAEGVVADGTADNWNLKFEWPADGNPTLTFKGATLKGAQNEYPLQLSGNVDLTVMIEADSSIETTNRAGFYVTNFGVTTVTGPGKLSISSTDGMCMQFAGSPTNLEAATGLIKDANLELTVTGSSSNRCAISFYGGNLTIDNSKIHITGVQKSLGIWGYGKYTKDATTGAITAVGSSWKAGENDTTKRNLIIQNGSEITGTINGRHALGANGDIIIKDSTVEVSVSSAENNMPIFSKKPVFEGNYTAIASEKKDGSGAVTYNASDYADYRYFKITPKAETPAPTPDAGGTTNNPQTGDTFNVALVSALALASMASLAAVTVIGKKKAI